MAKRHPNDRNAIAIRKRMVDEASDEFTTDNGRIIKLKDKPDLMFIQAATNSVEFPEKPTYTVKVGAREREYPLDELVIEQTDDPVEKKRLRKIWNQYMIDLIEANNLQGRRATGAMFYEGTVVQEDFDDPQWEKKMRISGWRVPEDPEERWVFYLQTSLSEDEIGRMSTKIVLRSGGATEEQIASAEQMFRDGLQAQPERPGNVEDTGADTEGN